MTKPLKTQALRDGKKREKLPCDVCQKHKLITQWHHIIPLEIVAEQLEIFQGDMLELACLCPNCHAIIHAYMKNCTKSLPDFNTQSVFIATLFEGYSDEEMFALQKIANKGLNLGN